MVKPDPEKAPSIKALYSDSGVGGKITRLVDELRQLQADAGSSLIALLLEKLIAFLEIARLVKDDKLATGISEDFQLLLMTVDGFFQSLPLSEEQLAPDVLESAANLLVAAREVEDLRVLTQRLRREADELRAQYQDHLRQDHGEMLKVASMIGGVAANHRKSLQHEERVRRLMEELESVRVSNRELQAELDRVQAARVEKNINTLSEQTRRLELAAERLVSISQGDEVTHREGLSSANILDQEIARRTAWLAQAAQMQAEAEEQRDPLIQNLGELKEQLKFVVERDARQQLEGRLAQVEGQLKVFDSYISELVMLQDRIKRGSGEMLIGYRRSLSKVQDPKFEADLRVATSEVLPDILPVNELSTSGSPDSSEEVIEGKRETLSQIAARVGLSPRNVLMITLFEILPRLKGVPPKRAEATIGAIASKIDLLRAYQLRFKSFVNFHTAVTEQPDFESYLFYAGKVNSLDLRRRTDKPLRWSVEDVITADQKSRFLDMLQERDAVYAAKRRQEKEGK